MIDFELMFSCFGSKAAKYLLEDEKTDNKALLAVRTESDAARIDKMRHWLQVYEVFQYIPSAQRSAIAAAVLRWADSQDKSTRLMTEDALCSAHEVLMKECCEAYGKKRNFISLASKALWLCYPQDTPFFDSFAQRALWIFAKMESGSNPLSEVELTRLAPMPEHRVYRQFVHIWKAFYDLNERQLTDVSEQFSYRYPVRIFDKILWIIGSPDYQ